MSGIRGLPLGANRRDSALRDRPLEAVAPHPLRPVLPLHLSFLGIFFKLGLSAAPNHERGKVE